MRLLYLHQRNNSSLISILKYYLRMKLSSTLLFLWKPKEETRGIGYAELQIHFKPEEAALGSTPVTVSGETLGSTSITASVDASCEQTHPEARRGMNFGSLYLYQRQAFN